jgi:hypothetical protein
MMHPHLGYDLTLSYVGREVVSQQVMFEVSSFVRIFFSCIVLILILVVAFRAFPLHISLLLQLFLYYFMPGGMPKI